MIYTFNYFKMSEYFTRDEVIVVALGTEKEWTDKVYIEKRDCISYIIQKNDAFFSLLKNEFWEKRWELLLFIIPPV